MAKKPDIAFAQQQLSPHLFPACISSKHGCSWKGRGPASSAGERGLACLSLTHLAHAGPDKTSWEKGSRWNHTYLRHQVCEERRCWPCEELWSFGGFYTENPDSSIDLGLAPVT